METIYLKCLMATIVTVGFLLISGLPAILISLLFVLYGLILVGKNEQLEMIAALALLLFGIFFRRVSGSEAPPTMIDLKVDATEETVQSVRDEPMTNLTSYLEVIKNAKREEEVKKKRQLEKWEQSSQSRLQNMHH
jgi:hypothetical protein